MKVSERLNELLTFHGYKVQRAPQSLRPGPAGRSAGAASWGALIHGGMIRSSWPMATVLRCADLTFVATYYGDVRIDICPSCRQRIEVAS